MKKKVEQALACDSRVYSDNGAGPGPLLRFVNETRIDRIPLYVTRYAFELVQVANPVIEGFVLPEALAGSGEQEIGLSGATAFDRFRNYAQILERLQQEMHMIWHHNEGSEVVVETVSIEDLIDYALGDFCSLQPFWAFRAIQHPISFHEIASVRDMPLCLRKHLRQTTRHEYCRSRRIPVRKISSVHSSELVQGAFVLLLRITG
jgi:hypothetical protein